MKIYEIYDEENNLSVGVLIYYEKKASYVIELQEELDEWTAPLLFSTYVKKGIYTMSSELSYLWVQERVIPSGRQNIGSILKTHRLKEYDEMKFLELSEGRCSQDGLCIKKLGELPLYAKNRAKKNITECFITDDNNILCFFLNGEIKKIDIAKLSYLEGIKSVINNRDVFESAKVGVGGYAIVFNDVIEISARDIYEEGLLIPLTINDFLAFAKKNILDTSESCYELECTRQNLSYMIKEKQISPIKENVKGNLYLKGSILKNKW